MHLPPGTNYNLPAWRNENGLAGMRDITKTSRWIALSGRLIWAVKDDRIYRLVEEQDSAHGPEIRKDAWP